MKRRALLLGLLLVLLVALPRCAYRIYTVGALNPLHPEALEPGAALSVAKDPEAKDFKWDEQLKGKLETLLTKKGYTTTTSADARYYLFFDYRIKALRERMRLELITGTQTGMETVTRAGPFVHTLALRVVLADAYRDRGEEDVVWQGGAVVNDIPTEGPSFHDMVLIAAMNQFGADTPETVMVKLHRNDPRARRLRKP